MTDSEWEHAYRAALEAAAKAVCADADCSDTLCAGRCIRVLPVPPRPDPTKEPGYYCGVCSHAMFLHSSGGNCGCGTPCSEYRPPTKESK